ncbi:MAG: hypothetical protein ACRCTG_15445 [Aestuariivirga sp.]
MPFEDQTDPLAPQGPLLPGVGRARDIAGTELAGAAFRQTSTVGSTLYAMASMMGVDPTPDPTFNGWDEIKDTRYAQYAGAFARAQNRSQFEAIKARIDQEDRDNQTIADAGGAGIVAALAAGLVDPTILLPGGAIYRSAKGGVSVARTAGVAALAGAAQGAASEALLQGSQITRSPDEWLTSVGSSAILSGLLGAGAGALVSKGERIALERALDEMRAPRDTGLSAPMAGDAGAAAADVRTGQYAGFGLDKVPYLGKAVEKLSPTLRVGQSVLQESRRILGDLAVLSLDTLDNARGVTTARGGISVEGEVMLLREKALYNALPEMDRLYREYRFGPEGGSVIERATNAMQGAVGSETGFLTKAQFNEEIGKAMRRGDVSDIPQVQAAAQKIRKDIIEPLKQRAIDAGLLPEDVKAKGAESWFARLYNREKIEAQGPEFVDRIANWLSTQEAEKQAIKGRLESLEMQRQALTDQVRRLDARLGTAERQMANLDARAAERGMETRATGVRADTLAGRAGDLRASISDLEEFVAAMRDELRDPEALARLDRMTADIRDLRKMAGPISDAEIKAVTKKQVDATFSGDFGKAVDVFLGKRSNIKGKSFLGIFTAQGIHDPSGEVRAVFDRNMPPGLLAKKSAGNTLDDWGQKLHESFPDVFPERVPPNEVLDMLSEAARGRDPAWWRERYAFKEEDIGLASYIEDTARELQRMFDEADIEVPKSRKEFVAAWGRLTGDDGGLVQAINDKLAATRDLQGAQVARDAVVQDRSMAREAIEAAIRERRSTERQLTVANARSGEAGMAAGRNERRMGILEQRMLLNDAKRDMLATARADAQRTIDDLMARIEKEVGEWNGTSAAEAKSALKAREKYAAETGRAPDAPRLTSADDAVGLAVKRILSRPERTMDDHLSRAAEIKDRIISTPDGRMPYDEGGGGKVGFSQGDDMQRGGPRGSLAARDFAIPDAMIEDFLDSNAEHMVKGFLRTFLPDVALKEKFGTTDLTEQFKRILDEANALERGAKTEAERVAIRDQANADIRDLAAMRDRIRGTYGADIRAKMPGLARAANVARVYNTLTSLGSSGLSSLPDLAGIVFRWGLGAVTGNGWAPYLKALVSDATAVKAQREQFRAMGIGIETWAAGRMQAMEAMNEAYHPHSRFERGMEAATQGFFIANLQAPLTDLAKHVAASVTSAEILRISKRVTEGKASQKDISRLTAATIDPDMARRIWADFSRPGAGEEIDGVFLPNLDRWQDREAAKRFEAALMREVNIAVITPGQEKPLFMSNPVLGIFGQFKSFVAGAQERLVLANMQRADFQAVQGVVVMMAAGAMSVAATSIASDRPLPERPQDWVKESIERSGMLGWLSEVNQLTAKATSGGADIYRLIGADKPLSRNAGTGVMGMLLGPTADKIDTFRKAVGAPFSEEGWTARDTADARRLLPLQNLWALRRAFNEAEDGINRSMGIQPLDRERLEW